MEKKDLRIVYMGTPDFAVESLKRLVEGGYNVVGVITMPDKPMGRHGSVFRDILRRGHIECAWAEIRETSPLRRFQCHISDRAQLCHRINSADSL